MKTLRAIVAVFLVLVASMSSAMSDDAVKLFAYGKLKNMYVLGSGIVASDQPVMQGGLTAEFLSGLYVDIWMSRNLGSTRTGNDFGNEIDLMVGWQGILGDAVRLNTGIAHYNLAPLRQFNASDILYLFGEVSPKEDIIAGPLRVSPYLRLEVRNSPVLGMDWDQAYIGGVRVIHPLMNKVQVRHTFQVSAWTATRYLEGGLVGSYRIEVPIQVTLSLSIAPMYERVEPFIKGRQGSNVFGLGFAYAF